MKKILGNYIAPYQCAFLKGGAIIDNILLAADLMNQVHSAKQGRKKLMTLKVDFARLSIDSHVISYML